MGRNRISIRFSGSFEIEIDDAVFDAVTNEWRKSFYDLANRDEIAAHIAYNLIANRAELSDLDGWADQPNSHVLIVRQPEWDVETYNTPAAHPGAAADDATGR